MSKFFLTSSSRLSRLRFLWRLKKREEVKLGPMGFEVLESPQEAASFFLCLSAFNISAAIDSELVVMFWSLLLIQINEAVFIIVVYRHDVCLMCSCLMTDGWHCGSAGVSSSRWHSCRNLSSFCSLKDKQQKNDKNDKNPDF